MKSFSSKKALQEAIKNQITSSDSQAIKAMLRIFEYQTEDEKESAGVYENNGVGFAGTDSEILTSFCKQYIKYGHLSDKQIAIIRKKIGKYACQLTKQAISNGIYVKQNGMWVVKTISDVKKFEVDAEFESHCEYMDDRLESFIVTAKNEKEAIDIVKSEYGRCLIMMVKEIK